MSYFYLSRVSYDKTVKLLLHGIRTFAGITDGLSLGSTTCDGGAHRTRKCVCVRARAMIGNAGTTINFPYIGAIITLPESLAHITQWSTQVVKVE